MTVLNRPPAGTYALTAIGPVSSAPATATVTVLAAATGRALPATLVLSSSTGTPGEVVTASGTGFRPNEAVTVRLSGASGQLVKARTNGDGVFTATFVVLKLSVGTRVVTATGSSSATAASQPFGTITTPHGMRNTGR